MIPFSFYEVANNAYFNSLTVIDADGDCLGLYRKSHIPDGPGYQEKFYFSPGDTGFKVFRTQYGVIGVGICWDQVIFVDSSLNLCFSLHFPEFRCSVAVVS